MDLNIIKQKSFERELRPLNTSDGREVRRSLFKLMKTIEKRKNAKWKRKQRLISPLKAPDSRETRLLAVKPMNYEKK